MQMLLDDMRKYVESQSHIKDENASAGLLLVRRYLDSLPEPLIDIVFDGPPGNESGRFVEVEDVEGHSINIGEWIHRNDGLWVLRIDIGRTP